MNRITGSNVTIMVKDMDRAIDFYQKLGLELKQRWGDNYAMVSGGGITLGIHPAGDTAQTSSGTLSIGFMIEKCADAKALLDSQGISYHEENDGKSGLYLHFKDPDGTIVYFVEPRW